MLAAQVDRRETVEEGSLSIRQVPNGGLDTSGWIEANDDRGCRNGVVDGDQRTTDGVVL